MHQRLSSLELHRERVRSTVEWMREVDANKPEQKFMTSVSYDKPKRFTGVPLEFDKSCEFSKYEREPVALVDGKVLAFRRKSLDSFVPEMLDMLRTAAEYDRTHDTARSYMGYATMYIWVHGHRNHGTRAIGMTVDNIQADLDYLYNEVFVPMIESIKQARHHYEVVFESDTACHVHFYFKVQYYPVPGCASNWGPDIKPVESLALFDIFTANAGDGTTNDCVLQCARRIWPVEKWGKEATEDTIPKLVARANNNVVILTPRGYVRDIRNVQNYGDLAFDVQSPVKDLRVIDPDLIYLVQWKKHIGVMEQMKTQIPHSLFTRFRPLQKHPKCKKLTVCFDIECYFDPESDTQHVPYLCCACFVYDDVPGNVVEFEGRDCVAQMVDWSAELAANFKHKHVELVAHNGGGYDFHYILSSMHNPSAVRNILIRNNHFISFKFNCDDIEFTVKDSLNFLLCSLSKAAKAFLCSTGVAAGEVAMPVLAKSEFPHHEVRSKEDLQRVFNEWIRVEQNVNANVEKERMLITVNHKIRYKEGGESKRLIDWAKEYCCNDVIVLANVWVKFKKTVADIFNCHIVDQTHTLAGMSFRLFEAHLQSD
ncbi:hypothetical protein GGI11_005829, partial [Coemansia sp. RSA 2049]